MKMYDFEGSILEMPLTVTFMRLTKRIDLPQDLARRWGKFPFLLKKDDMITIIPKTIVANTIHIIINSVRIISFNPIRVLRLRSALLEEHFA